MTAVLAPSLVKLRTEVNAKWPGRDKSSDGWLGDAAHAARQSEHNPDAKGMVHALDIDITDVNTKALLKELIGDPRVWYVIHKGVIWSRTYGWRARHYTGPNPHTGHVHVSIRLLRGAERDASPWFPGAAIPAPRGGTTKPAPSPKVTPAKTGSSHAPGSRTLRQGMKGADVEFVQAFIGAKKTGPADGIYGRKTASGVAWYQRMRGVKVTGEVDKATWRSMLGADGRP